MVHTDMCFLFHCNKPFLCDTVNHRSRLDKLIHMHTTFLCRTSAILVKFVFNFITCQITQKLQCACISSGCTSATGINVVVRAIKNSLFASHNKKFEFISIDSSSDDDASLQHLFKSNIMKMNSIFCDEREIMIFLNCFHDNIYTSCVLLEPECIQAH